MGREIANDLNSDVVNWWRVLRDPPAELADLLEWTPAWSADLFAKAAAGLDHEDPVRRAYNFTLVCSWVLERRGGGGSAEGGAGAPVSGADAARPFGEPGTGRVTEFYGSNPNATIYLDPPYPTVQPLVLYASAPPHV